MEKETEKAVDVEQPENDEFTKAIADKLEEAANQAAQKAAETVIDKISKAGSRPSIQVVAEPFENQGGFRRLSDFAKAVRLAESGSTEAHEQLDKCKKMISKATGQSVGVPADGGNAVPQPFIEEIMQPIIENSKLFGRTNQMQLSGVGSGRTIPRFNHYTIGSYGATIQNVAVTADGTAIDPSKTAVDNVEIKVHRKSALIPATEEVLEDAVTFESAVRKLVTDYFNYELDRMVLRGSGSGEGDGLFDHSSAIGVGRTTGGTIKFADIRSMYGKRMGDQEYVWIASPTAEAELFNLADSGNNSLVGKLITVNGNGQLVIMGMPVIRTIHASPLGTDGDLILADLDSYVSMTKGGFDSAVSTDLYFNKHETAFRWSIRVGGRPLWDSAFTDPNDGTVTYSHFVQLMYTT